MHGTACWTNMCWYLVFTYSSQFVTKVGSSKTSKPKSSPKVYQLGELNLFLKFYIILRSSKYVEYIYSSCHTNSDRMIKMRASVAFHLYTRWWLKHWFYLSSFMQTSVPTRFMPVVQKVSSWIDKFALSSKFAPSLSQIACGFFVLEKLYAENNQVWIWLDFTAGKIDICN